MTGIGPKIGGGGADTSLDEVLWADEGILSDNGFPHLFAVPVAPATQLVTGVLLPLRGGTPVTGVVLRNSVAAAGTLPTTGRFGIADKTGKILALSGNLNALASWGLGALRFPFAAQYTPPADGGYYACFVVNGTWGSTQPTPANRSGNSNFSTAVGTAAPLGFQWAAQTDLPAVGASLTLSTGLANVYYMAFY